MSFDLTNKNISDTYQNLLQKTGSNNQLYDLSGNPVQNLTIKGALIAESYIVSQSSTVFSSGSTAFGNSLDDTHNFIGGIVAGNITASGNISASGDVYADNLYIDGTKALSTSGTELFIGGNVNTWTELKYGRESSDNHLFNGTLNINDPSTIQLHPAGHITASGNISSSGEIIGSSLTITDDLSLRHITASGNITTTGTLTAEQITSTDDMTVEDDLSVGGELSVNGSIPKIIINQNAFGATTDSIIVFQKGGANQYTMGSDNESPNKFKINSGGSLDAPSDFQMDTSGNVTLKGFISASSLISHDDLTVSDDIIVADGSKIVDGSDLDDYIIFDQTNRRIDTFIDNATVLSVGNGQVGINTTPVANMELTVRGDISASGDIFNTQTIQMTAASSTVINTFNTSSFQTCKYLLQVTSASSIQSSEMLVVQNSSNAFNTEYSQINSGLNLVDFTTDVNNSNVRLLGNSSFISCSVKFIRTLI